MNEPHPERFLVAGAGVMGGGIAQVLAQSGYTVHMVDRSDDLLSTALGKLDHSLSRLVRSGRLTAEDAKRARERVSTGTDLEAAAADADLVVEAITENLEMKVDLFGRLDEICPGDVVFATNTSQFSITSIAARTSRPANVIGTHWMNPPPIMRLVEVVRGHQTSDTTLETTLAVLNRCGKEAIVCKRDSQGFITSRLLLMLNLEAARILEEGVADVEDINKACVAGLNHAMGPLATLDLGGLDTSLFAADAMREHFGDRFLAPQTMRRLVAAGRLGRKTGQGFSVYGGEV